MAPTYKDFTWLTKKLQLCQFVISKSSSTDSAAHTLQHAFEKCHLNFLRHKWSDINLLTSWKLPLPMIFLEPMMHQGSLRVPDHQSYLWSDRDKNPNKNILTVMILEHLFGRLNCKHEFHRKTQPFRTMKYFTFPFQRLVIGWVSHHPPTVLGKFIWIYFPRMNPWPLTKWFHPLGNHHLFLVVKSPSQGKPFTKPCNFWQNIFTWSRFIFPVIGWFPNLKLHQQQGSENHRKFPRGENLVTVRSPRAPSRLENSELLMAECPKTSERNDEPVGTGGQKLHVWKRLGEKKRPQRCL